MRAFECLRSRAPPCITLAYEVLTITAEPGLFFMIYTAEPGSPQPNGSGCSHSGLRTNPRSSPNTELAVHNEVVPPTEPSSASLPFSECAQVPPACDALGDS